MPDASTRIQRAAARLAAAYSEKSRITLAPDLAPETPSEAMAVQAEVARLLGAEVGGWKVAIRPDGLAAAAPMFRHLIVPEGQSSAILDNGPIGIEIEICIRLARDLPPRPGKPYTREDIVAACDRVFAGIEIVTPRLDKPFDIPFTTFLADNVGNGGYVMGGGVDDVSRVDLTNLRCVFDFNGEVAYDKVGGHPAKDPLVFVLACANAQIDKLGGFKAGQLITTGSLGGIFWRGKGEQVNARIEGLGTVSMRT